MRSSVLLKEDNLQRGKSALSIAVTALGMEFVPRARELLPPALLGWWEPEPKMSRGKVTYEHHWHSLDAWGWLLHYAFAHLTVLTDGRLVYGHHRRTGHTEASDGRVHWFPHNHMGS